VAKALGISTPSVRDEWSAFDLQMPEGLKVQVKSVAYIQTWYQSSLSKISFRTRKTNQLADLACDFAAAPVYPPPSASFIAFG
jgi:hypothetical protein